MINPTISNPNDFKVVDFTNRTSFDFIPEMGCMFDSRPIFGISGFQGIKAGESIKLPYHIGHRLAVNLAKVMITQGAPSTDAAGIPTGVPLWDAKRLETLKDSFITDLYSEAKPIAETEIDRLIKRVSELNKLVEENIVNKQPITALDSNTSADTATDATGSVYKDKAEVITELTKRGIPFDARSGKATLEKLLA